MGDLTKEAFKNLNNSIEYNQSAQEELKDVNIKYDLTLHENTKLNKENLRFKKEIHLYKDQNDNLIQEIKSLKSNEDKLMKQISLENQKILDMAKELEKSKFNLNKKESELSKSLEIMEEMNNKLTDLAHDNTILHQKLNDTQLESESQSNPNLLVKQIKNYKDVLSSFRSSYYEAKKGLDKIISEI